MRKLFVSAIALLALLSSQAVLAQGKGKGHGNSDESESNDRPRGSIVFGTHDREIIRDFYHDRFSNLPPGLAKRGGDLPPGLKKHLRRNGTLPPGLQKRIEPFPGELEARLPRLPDIYRRVILGQIGIILDRRSQRIMDVIQDVLNP